MCYERCATLITPRPSEYIVSADQDRIVELETKLAYQEHTIEQLDQSLQQQQQQVSVLQRQLQLLQQQIKNITDNESVTGTAMPEPPPPHY